MWLKQSTTTTFPMGPFIDSADALTEEEALVIQKADVLLSKNAGSLSAASADQGASDAGATHIGNGYYEISLDATDTNTLGKIRIVVHKTGALPIWQDFHVVHSNVYDSLVSGSDLLQVDAAAFDGSETAAAAAQACFDGATTSFDELESTLGSEHDATQAALVLVNASVDSILTDTDVTIPGLITGLSIPTAASIADAVFDESVGGHTIVGTFGKVFVDILADTEELQAAWTDGGRLDLLIDAILVDTDVTIPGLLSSYGDLSIEWATDTYNEVIGQTATLATLATAADLATLQAALPDNFDMLLITPGGWILRVDTVMSLDTDALDNISASVPNGPATTFRGRLMQLWARFFYRHRKTATDIETYREGGGVLNTTQPYTSDDTIDDVGEAT